eukprot:765189-Hanusia_phi.AAC.1
MSKPAPGPARLLSTAMRGRGGPAAGLREGSECPGEAQSDGEGYYVTVARVTDRGPAGAETVGVRAPRPGRGVPA